MTAFVESVVEDAALAWLEAIGWRIAHGARRGCFKPWRTIAGDTLAGAHVPELTT